MVSAASSTLLQDLQIHLNPQIDNIPLVRKDCNALIRLTNPKNDKDIQKTKEIIAKVNEFSREFLQLFKLNEDVGIVLTQEELAEEEDDWEEPADYDAALKSVEDYFDLMPNLEKANLAMMHLKQGFVDAKITKKMNDPKVETELTNLSESDKFDLMKAINKNIVNLGQLADELEESEQIES